MRKRTRITRTAGYWCGGLMIVALLAGCHDEGAPSEADAGSPKDAGDQQEQYVADVTFIEGERTPGSAHWQAVQDLCAERLADLGYEVELQAYETGVNVIGVRRGTSIPDEQVLISAHYDSTRGCPGADDNGSGVAAVLEAARLLATEPHSRTLVAACWDEEERRSDDDESTNGSKAYARRARERGEAIVAAVALDGIAYASDEPNSQRLPDGLESMFPEALQQIEENDARGDFVLAVFDSRSHGFVEWLVDSARAEELPTVLFELPVERLTDPALSELRRSDHSAFWDHDYPGLLLTDTANYRSPYYHCEEGPDTVDTLDMDFALRVVRSVTAAAARALGDT